MPSAHETVRAAAAGVSAHLLWQVAARFSSFLIRALVVRALGPAQFAFVEIRLTLLVTLSLLPACHAFRTVALRAPNHRIAAAVCYVSILSTFLIGLLFGYIAIRLDPIHTLALQIASLSVLLRAFVEPAVVFARRRERYAQSSRARAISVVISSISHTIAVSLISDPQHVAPAGAFGHLAYVICLAIFMFIATGPQRIPLLSISEFHDNLRKDDLVMVLLASGEGLLKFILENGEGIILDFVCTANVKGAYKLAGNIASIFARFFSEALEEQCFNVFNRLAPAFRTSQSASPDCIQREGEMRETCISTLLLAVKAAITVSILFAFIGPAYSYSFIRLLYGKEWADDTSAPMLLNQYFTYLVFMAANGVSEAFVTASASTSELSRRTKFSSVLSVVYMITLFLVAKNYGASGIIFVNCMNMALRTCYSAWFFQKLTDEPLTTLRKVFPHQGVVAALIVAQRISIISENYFLKGRTQILELGRMEMLTTLGLHSLSGVLALAMFTVSLRIFERGFIKQLRSLRSHQD